MPGWVLFFPFYLPLSKACSALFALWQRFISLALFFFFFFKASSFGAFMGGAMDVSNWPGPEGTKILNGILMFLGTALT